MKNNNQYDQARKSLKDKTTRQARVARRMELERLKEPKEAVAYPGSFKAYVEMREASSAKSE